MWKNKHIIVALLVAPVLAITAYFSVDYFVAERPHAALPGSDYPLVAKSNCRYDSGECELENGDVKLRMTATNTESNHTRLNLTSVLALSSVKVALAYSVEDNAAPVDLVADNQEATSWSIELGEITSDDARLRLVVTAGESRYFAEVPIVFFTEREAFGTR